MQISTSDLTAKEKSIGVLRKNAQAEDSDSMFRPEPNNLALEKLLGASKDAEVLIACIFELHSIAAAPLLEIWDRLAAAINEAQAALQAMNVHGPSALSIRINRKRRR
jgi:hypothetical protein